MSETSIRISLELADKAAQKALTDFVSKGEAAEKAIGKVGKSGKSTFNEISVGIGKSIGVFDIFAGNIAANLTIKAFETLSQAAGALFQTFIVDGVQGAIAAQDALNSLNVSLAQSGIYSKETSQEIQDLAEELQATTRFEDDLIIKNAALIQSLGDLDKDGLKRATVAAVNLSAALGRDLGQASEALGKAANGNVTALQKMGLQIEKGQTNAETFANALRAVEERFDGAAAAKITTYSGAVEQTSNSFGNLIEEIGNFIVKNPAVVQAINEVGKIFTELTSLTKGQSGAFIQLIGEGLSKFLTVSVYVVTAADALVRVFQTLYGAIQVLATPLLAITVPLNALRVGFTEAAKQAEAYANSTVKNLTALGKNGDGALASLATNLLRVRDAADKGLDSLARGADATIHPLNNSRNAVKDLSEEMQRGHSRIRAFADELIKQGESGTAAMQTQLESAKIKADSEILIQEDLLRRKLISESQFLTQKAEIESQFEAVRQELELQKYSADNARLIEFRNKGLGTESEFYAAKKVLDDKYIAGKEKAQLEADAREKKNKILLETEEEKRQRERAQNFRSTLSYISTLQQSSNKEAFAIGKAANIAQATMDGIAAVQVALKSAPVPFNFALAGLVGAAAAANVSRIASTKAPSFQDGGIVPGNSYSGDRVQANVNSGELILNRRQQATLFQMANGTGFGGGNLEGLMRQNNALLSVIASGIQQGSKIVINGREIMDVIRGELNGGRSFA